MSATTFPARRHPVLPWINLGLGVAAISLAAVAITSDDTGSSGTTRSPAVVIMRTDPGNLVADLGSCQFATQGEIVRC